MEIEKKLVEKIIIEGNLDEEDAAIEYLKEHGYRMTYQGPRMRALSSGKAGSAVNVEIKAGFLMEGERLFDGIRQGETFGMFLKRLIEERQAEATDEERKKILTPEQQEQFRKTILDFLKGDGDGQG